VNLDFFPEKLRAAVLDVATLVQQAGGRAFLVGGAVRDLMLGIPLKDIDIEVFGLMPDALKTVLAAHYDLDLVGLSFGVLKFHHLDIDVSLPRRESKRGLGHKGFEISSDPSLTVAEAASRRDFTVNALYFNPLSGELVDPYHGADDLKAGILRHVSPQFVEDPLRVLRGMQFIARFGLVPVPETVTLCQTMTMEGLPPERLLEEWAKLLTKGVKISAGLEFLRATTWLRFFPELAALVGCQQDPAWHPEGDVWNHTLCCLDAFAKDRQGAMGVDGGREDLIVGFAVLCHDFGKPTTTAYERGHIRSLGHEEAGGVPTESFLRRLTNEADLIRDVKTLVVSHLKPFSLWCSKAGDSAVRRLAVKVGRIDRLLRVCRADQEGRPPIVPELREVGWLRDRAAALAVAAAAPKPLVQGRDLIALGMRPGPEFGRLTKLCYEAQLDGKFADFPGGLAYLKTLITSL